jgi:hypothetical protein
MDQIAAALIRQRVVTDTDAILDGPDQASRQKDVRVRETITHEVAPTVPERHLNVTQLCSEVFTFPALHIALNFEAVE